MKKLLLASTALLIGATAVQAQEDPIKIGISGFSKQYFSVQDNDNERVNYFEQWSDPEVIFTGKTIVMGGNEVGVNIQLEGRTQGDTIDQSYLYVEGTWGRFVIGSYAGAGALMAYGAPNVGRAINSGDQGQYILGTANDFYTPAGSTFLEPVAQLVSADPDNTENNFVVGDDNGQKITYFTPRYSGFQFGVSFFPDLDGTGGDINQPDPASRHADNTHDYGASVGLNYVQDYEGGTSVAASFHGVWSHAKEDVLDLKGDEQEDYIAGALGLNVGFAAGEGTVTVGGSVSYSPTEDVITEGFGWDAGISYAVDRTAVSITYFQSEMEEDSRERDAVQGSVTYRIGTGVNVVGAVGWAHAVCCTGTGARADAGGGGSDFDNSGMYGYVGLEVTF